MTAGVRRAERANDNRRRRTARTQRARHDGRTFDGLVAESQNRWPSLAFDIGAVNGLFSPFLSAPASTTRPSCGRPHCGSGCTSRRSAAPRASVGRRRRPIPTLREGLGALRSCWSSARGPAGLAAALTAARAGVGSYRRRRRCRARRLAAQRDRDARRQVGQRRRSHGCSANCRALPNVPSDGADNGGRLVRRHGVRRGRARAEACREAGCSSNPSSGSGASSPAAPCCARGPRSGRSCSAATTGPGVMLAEAGLAYARRFGVAVGAPRRRVRDERLRAGGRAARALKVAAASRSSAVDRRPKRRC